MSVHNEYPADFVDGLQWMWGKGFLSPGGPEEVSRIVSGIDLKQCRILDIGCGLAGADLHLVNAHEAAFIVGVDVEADLVEQSRKLVQESGLSERIEIKLVERGELPFSEDEFDLVFSKDSMVHIPDKKACYLDIRRLLKPDGILALGDWFGSSQAVTKEMEQWLEVVGLKFELGTLEDALATLESIGFDSVSGVDRNSWYAGYMVSELKSLSGDNYPGLAALIGEYAASQRLESSTLKKTVVEQGQLRPGHIRAINRK